VLVEELVDAARSLSSIKEDVKVEAEEVDKVDARDETPRIETSDSSLGGIETWRGIGKVGGADIGRSFAAKVKSTSLRTVAIGQLEAQLEALFSPVPS
jgi:hypothetical protein